MFTLVIKSIFLIDSVVTCQTLRQPSNGLITSSGSSVGSIATYTCNTGFRLKGSPLRLCTQSRAWSGTAPTCEAGGMYAVKFNSFDKYCWGSYHG